jgi:site-specific recombinase XerD
LFGKGRKSRVLPLMGKTVQHLTEYLHAFHRNPDNNDYLFYTVIHSKREQMSPDTVAYFLKNYGELARRSSPLFPERVHPHLLRHSRAMGLYKSKVPLPLIARFLGHVDINTTDIYATADLVMMKDAMERVSLDFTPGIKPKWEGNEDMMLKLCGLA